MAARVVIQHVNGSKANQLEQFPLEGLTEITFGRDPDNMVAFDPQRDDMASRKHAVIRSSGGEQPRFSIADLGSANGTFVNGEKLTGQRELLPEDTIELGSGGPKFSFDVQPRPSYMVARTRVISVPSQAAMPAATRVISTGTASTMPPPPPIPTRVGVGRETVQRMLSEERRSTSRTWMYVLAGVLVLFGGGAAALYYTSNQASLRAEQKLASARAEMARNLAEEQKKTEARMGLSAEDVAHKFGNATVQIFMEWRAIDKDTGRPIYHKVINVKGVSLPCYVDIPNIGIVRWLTSEDQDRNNHLVGGAGQGSGFVVSPNGFIMTNKHVAAGWRIEYIAYSGEYEDGRGLLFRFNDRKAHFQVVDLNSEDMRKALKSWVPADGAVIFDPRVPVPLAASKNQVTGENLDLSVRFPGNPGAIQAKLVTASETADAAEIKIDTGQNLANVTMSPDDDVRVGEHVTVLGFPGFSTETHALRTSMEGGELHKFDDVVPEPTVTEGLISLLSPPPKQVGDVTMVGEMGDAYQLTVPTSHGNSGGPVFDSTGKVVALFTYGDPSRETHTFAVPIRYARDLLQMQREN